MKWNREEKIMFIIVNDESFGEIEINKEKERLDLLEDEELDYLINYIRSDKLGREIN